MWTNELTKEQEQNLRNDPSRHFPPIAREVLYNILLRQAHASAQKKGIYFPTPGQYNQITRNIEPTGVEKYINEQVEKLIGELDNRTGSYGEKIVTYTENWLETQKQNISSNITKLLS
jgi:hypothetical protein